MKTSQRGFIVPLLLLIGVVIVVGFGFYHYQQKAKQNQIASTVATTTVSDTTPTPAITDISSTVPTTTPATPATASSKDCGSDMSCLIVQANTCAPASVEFSSTVNLFEAGDLTTTSNIVIGKTATAGACSFTERTDKVTAVRLNAQGGEVGPTESDNSSVGTVEACPAIPATKLVALLDNWNKGNFDSNDLDAYNCKTTLPKALTDAMAKQQQQEEFTGLTANISNVFRNDYSFTVSDETSNSITLQLKGNDQSSPATPVKLVLNTPATYLGYTFTLNSIDNKYGNYSGTVAVDKVQ